MKELTREIIENPSSAPYAKVRGWMTSPQIKLSGDELTTFALLYELGHPDGDDSKRITMSYICDACGINGPEAFDIITKLSKKELVSFRLDSETGSFLDNFAIDEDGLRRALEGADPRARRHGKDS